MMLTGRIDSKRDRARWQTKYLMILCEWGMRKMVKGLLKVTKDRKLRRAMIAHALMEYVEGGEEIGLKDKLLDQDIDAYILVYLNKKKYLYFYVII